MLNRLTLVVALWVLISIPQTVDASPITYDFTGTVTQPFDGSRGFNGTLTIDATPMILPGVSGVMEDGSNVSLSLNFGGRVLDFANLPQNPSVSATFSAYVVSPEYEQPSGTPETEFAAGGVISGTTGITPTISFGMTFYSLGVGSLPTNLATLPLTLGTSSAVLTEFTGGSGPGSLVGFGPTITSIEIVSAPEPSTMSILLGLGLAALVRRGCRRFRSRNQWAQVD